jgi:hypothetical protein
LRRQYYFDGLLLVYYFGFLDGDGKGTRLHQYYQRIAQESLAARTPGAAPPVNTAARAQELIETIVAGRTDAQLHDDLVARFRAIGVKIE